MNIKLINAGKTDYGQNWRSFSVFSAGLEKLEWVLKRLQTTLRAPLRGVKSKNPFFRHFNWFSIQYVIYLFYILKFKSNGKMEKESYSNHTTL